MAEETCLLTAGCAAYRRQDLVSGSLGNVKSRRGMPRENTERDTQRYKVPMPASVADCSVVVVKRRVMAVERRVWRA